MKRIGILMGDPCGIGPEVALKAIDSIDRRDDCSLVLIGSRAVFEREVAAMGLDLRLTDDEPVSSGSVRIIESVGEGTARFDYGEPSRESGMAAYKSILKGVELATSGALDAIVTGPISKRALHLAGSESPGHTELLAELTKAPRYAMMLTADKLRVTLVTTHMAISQVAGRITSKAVLDRIELSFIFLEHYAGTGSPAIGVCALNPHGGEQGEFGSEETEIAKAVRSAVASGIRAEGPLPADSLFAHWQKYDCIVANYHDQGLIPVKMQGFDRAVNVTLGLPIVRTSPGHGTAFDIAGKGKANPTSMMEAIRLAREMAFRGSAKWKN